MIIIVKVKLLRTMTKKKARFENSDIDSVDLSYEENFA